MLPSDQPEDPSDANARHWVHGKLAFATVDQLDDLTEKVDIIQRTLTGDKSKDTEDTGLVGAVRRITIWLQGNTSETGIPTSGVMQRLAALVAVKNYLLVCASAVTIGVLVQAAVAVLNHLHGAPVVPVVPH